MNKIVFSLIAVLSISACSNKPAVSDSEALARLAFLEKLDEKEYQKASVRDEESYQTYRQRRLDALEDQKIALQNERIHYQNQAIQYQNTRQATKDMIDDIGQIQMNRAKAINKANENISKKQDIFIIR